MSLQFNKCTEMIHANSHFVMLFFMSILYSSSSQSINVVFARFLFPPAINFTNHKGKDRCYKERGFSGLMNVSLW